MISREKVIILSVVVLANLYMCNPWSDNENKLISSGSQTKEVDCKFENDYSTHTFSSTKVNDSSNFIETEDGVYNKHITYSRSKIVKRQEKNDELEEKVRRYPYMVAVRWDNKMTICIGTVISHWHILTAAHCIIRTASGEQREAKRLSVRVGSKYRTRDGSIYNIRRWFAPFNYVRKDKANDVAVLELSTYLEFSNTVNLIPLVSLDDEPAIEEISNVQQPCFIFGWPKNSRKRSSVTKNDILRIDDSESEFAEYFDVEAVQVLSRSLCKTLAKPNHVSVDGETEVCSKYVMLERPCKANTGGPLVCQLKQYGILSRQRGCDKDTGIIVYSRTDIYFDFITDAMTRRDLEIERSGEMEKMSKQSCLHTLENTFIILTVNLLLICL